MNLEKVVFGFFIVFAATLSPWRYRKAASTNWN